MNFLKSLYFLLRALFTAPDVLHWIKKYEAAKHQASIADAAVQQLREVVRWFPAQHRISYSADFRVLLQRIELTIKFYDRGHHGL